MVAWPSWAVEAVITKGKLSDRDFYRIVACAAPPGQQCQKPVLRWDSDAAKDLTIRITETQGEITTRRLSAVQSALRNAVDQINGVGAGVKLRLIQSGAPDISVVVLEEGFTGLRDRARSIDDIFVLGSAAAMAEVFTRRGSPRIQSGKVTMTGLVDNRRLASVMLEEVVQALGLLTDIHNGYYHTRSIFSETGGRVKRLRGQDAMALRTHYPN
ncbi:MAG: hypothetical protein AAFN59_08285 [Pseudomonadota bacterium]